MTQSERKLIIDQINSAVASVSEARAKLEELESMASEYEDEQLEADSYDWHDAIESVENLIDEYKVETLGIEEE